ncbi:MAG: hypothetical protein KGI50_03200 [Patescibacteria group bacterium]|nr:hypothetical protein [Patescibacteria group bacterium]MDE2438298.1 hypothetical protein [Patescibacteria group bacterium]
MNILSSFMERLIANKFYAFVVGVLVVVILGTLYYIGTNPAFNEQHTSPVANTPQSSSPSTNGMQGGVPQHNTGMTSSPAQHTGSPSANLTASVPSKTVEATGAFALTPQRTGACSALLPVGWTGNASPQSDAVDFVSPDRTLYAGYGVLGVNSAMQVYDPALYSPDPGTSIQRLASLAAQGALGDGSPMQFTNDYNQQIGSYTLRSVESAGSKGVVFYRIFPGDGYNTTYIEAARFALVRKSLWPTKGLLVARIAASIQCSTQLVARDNSVISTDTGGGDTSSDTSSDNSDGYNPQLGTEYVHNPDTGENYLVSNTENWASDGPQGAGYYAQSGNDYVKLAPGLSN